MKAEEYKEITRRFIEDYHMSFAHFPDFTANSLFHLAGVPGPMDLAATQQMSQVYATAFPDMSARAEEILVEGNKAVCRWTATATHLGDLMGIPATGKKVTLTGICIERFEGGKIAEHWVNMDQFGLLVQLGAIPVPAAA